ncbi:MAG: preprotein translocase subunit SecG [Denitrovibrio sp.]|nr:MAG: preprotein translocase subunit SecG [Denitrovibrio sp.]
MYTIVLALHLFVCFLLIMAVLLQAGKGSSLGAAFGGGQGDVFGPGTPVNIMNRITTIVAILFMLTSLTLAILSTQKTTDSVVDQFKPAATEQTVPAPAEKPVVPSESK